MKAVGIICEYNPFHAGHLRQFRWIRSRYGEDTPIVCLMSGNYVQRGMPAMWDKFTRAQAALECGADLVLELPITAVLRSAEGFAATGVDIFSRMGCVDTLCFGVESGSAETFMKMASQLDLPEFQQNLRAGLDRGLPYAAARQEALGDHGGCLSTPNNILALEYCRAVLTQNSSLTPVSVLRNGDYHTMTPDPEAPSATAVRNLFPNEGWDLYVPAAAAAVLREQPWYDIRFGERAVLARLRALDDEQWESCAHGSEGLWRKAMKAVRTQPDLEAVIGAIKSKRYPRTRIQRLLLCAYLGISSSELLQPVPYVRALAANRIGCSLLRHAKQSEQICIVNAGEQPDAVDYYRMEERASRLYSLFSAPEFTVPCDLESGGRIYLK